MNILHPFFGWVGLSLTSTEGALNDAHHSKNHLVFVMLILMGVEPQIEVCFYPPPPKSMEFS